jgi:aspartate-semialdehyde dehydrogenase
MISHEKTGVAVLGATGLVGQTIVSLLDGHPWFEVTALCASDQNVGRSYADAVGGRWLKANPIPAWARDMVVQACDASLPGAIALSALDARAAADIEDAFVAAGWWVCTNAGAHRMRADVPLIIPEINADHLDTIIGREGGIVANPNCCVAGLALALAPLHRRFGLETVHVATLQALSGAGYPGRSGLDIVDNVIPHIPGEEEKLEREPLKILGETDAPASFALSAQCHRVPVLDGHLLSITAGFSRRIGLHEVAAAWREFSRDAALNLPTAPAEPLVIRDEEDRPQPRLDRDRGAGMSVSIGRLRRDTVLDVRFTALVHNLVRGAAGAALVNAEALVSRRVTLREDAMRAFAVPAGSGGRLPI